MIVCATWIRNWENVREKKAAAPTKKKTTNPNNERMVRFLCFVQHTMANALWFLYNCYFFSLALSLSVFLSLACSFPWRVFVSSEMCQYMHSIKWTCARCTHVAFLIWCRAFLLLVFTLLNGTIYICTRNIECIGMVSPRIKMQSQLQLQFARKIKQRPSIFEASVLQPHTQVISHLVIIEVERPREWPIETNAI